MTCTQFRDVLDAYIDHELAPDAMASATAHRSLCSSCDRLVLRALDTKAAVRRTATAHAIPSDLEARLRLAIAPRWRPWHLTAAAAVLIVALWAGLAAHGRIESGAANAMDQMALRLDGSSPVVLTGTLLCRDCELEHRYGIQAPCKTIGHHGALATDDGRIWNLVEQKVAADLIHDASLLGRRVVVHGRIFRGARALVIDTYEFAS
ncbi:MAG: anti-sigma factor [Vicinamibacterales bacterium]